MTSHTPNPVLRCQKCFGKSGKIKNGIKVCSECLINGDVSPIRYDDEATKHNQWVDELKNEIEFEPLLDFLERLKD